jgi:hypothetical protein
VVVVAAAVVVGGGEEGKKREDEEAVAAVMVVVEEEGGEQEVVAVVAVVVGRREGNEGEEVVPTRQPCPCARSSACTPACTTSASGTWRAQGGLILRAKWQPLTRALDPSRQRTPCCCC